jgi:hypothetical protein
LLGCEPTDAALLDPLDTAPQAADPASPSPAITPLMLRIETVITRLAATRQAMPGFAALAERAAAQGRQSAAKAFDRLVAIGRLAIEARPGERRIVVVISGERTAWAPWSPGHRPFSAHARGQPPALRPRRPDYRPDGSSQFRYKTEVVALVPTFPARTCQNPRWGWGARPTHRYCEQPSVHGTSWCADCLGALVPEHPAARALRACVAVAAPPAVAARRPAGAIVDFSQLIASLEAGALNAEATPSAPSSLNSRQRDVSSSLRQSVKRRVGQACISCR